MPRQANARILQAIADLTKHAGYPPTFDEVAVEAGFPRNSRGAVYKQLVRLRGQYVEWEDQIPRSLRLLNADLIHMASNSGEALAPESGQTSSDLLMLFSLLASGLTQLLTRENLNRQLPIYPDALRRGLSQLALWAIQNGKSYPRDLPEAMGLFRTPFRNWPLPMIPIETDPDDVLLVGDEPSEVCYELAIQTSDVEAEITERNIARVRDICRIQGREDAYVQFRRFLIEHPVASRLQIIEAGLRLPAELINLLSEAYETVPESAVNEGAIHTCGFCGWTLRWDVEGRPRCDSKLCEQITRGSQLRGRRIPVLPGTLHEWRRVKRGIRRFIVAPGQSELRLAQRLTDLGLSLDLWPRYDSYDLKLVFPDGEVWAVDVKDWENPWLMCNQRARTGLQHTSGGSDAV